MCAFGLAASAPGPPPLAQGAARVCAGPNAHAALCMALCACARPRGIGPGRHSLAAEERGGAGAGLPAQMLEVCGTFDRWIGARRRRRRTFGPPGWPGPAP